MKFLTTLCLTACFAVAVSAQSTTTTTTTATTTTAAPAPSTGSGQAPSTSSGQAASTSSGQADALGLWNATFTTQNGQIPATIKLEKTGEKITGTIASQMGESALTAEVTGKAVAIWFTMQGQNGAIPIELSGTVDGDTFKGTASAGGSQAGDFIATRDKTAKPAAPATAKPDTPAAPTASLTGNWNLSIELPNMTATPSMVLKQDGEKLSGEYVSQQYGKYAITGTIKGADVSFWFGMNVEGTALNVTYTGKVDKDGAIAGTVNYGDMMNGTFTATKQK
jgi:hypothetical protein